MANAHSDGDDTSCHEISLFAIWRVSSLIIALNSRLLWPSWAEGKASEIVGLGRMSYAPSPRNVLADVFRRLEDVQAGGFGELDVFVLGFQWWEEHAVYEQTRECASKVSKRENQTRSQNHS